MPYFELLSKLLQWWFTQAALIYTLVMPMIADVEEVAHICFMWLNRNSMGDRKIVLVLMHVILLVNAMQNLLESFS